MGVTGLWTVVAPTARPTSLASLNRKRLAVDASIWIYQFLKAVRDKEGNALRNSHVVGFFRRICKLLYFGIKPVFVFDGGAPALKRETIRRRKGRREGRREDAVRTAGKLLAVQMERSAEEEERRRRAGRKDVEEELPDDAELVYVEEIGMDKQERTKQRGEGFKRKDQYHLPNLDISISELGAPDDPRIMSQAELEEYARQFHSGEDINLYDFSKIDFESPFFQSLPAGDRYNILNAARLRSRLRMGYSKEQLEGMFPDRMAFSRFQIERVKERNELTQRLMHINGGNEFDLNQGGRIAGEKGKEYVLVKNEGVEGGWALGVVSNREGTKREHAIDLDAESPKPSQQDDTEDDEDFEDVAIEGLNRLPQTWKRKRQPREVDYDISYEDATAVIAKKRKAVYDARKEAAVEKQFPNMPASNGDEQHESLFLPQGESNVDNEDDDLFEDVNIEVPAPDEEDDDLQRALAMSMEKPEDRNVLMQDDAMLMDGDEEKEEEGFDMQAALAESRKSRYQPKTNVRAGSPKPTPGASKFSGPLPFESLNLGQSLLGKKKSKKTEEDLSGGFDRDLGEDAFRKEKPPQPMPEWFNAPPSMRDFRNVQDQVQQEPEVPDSASLSQEKRSILKRHQTNEVIDLEVENTQKSMPEKIDISSDEEAELDVQEQPAEERMEWEMPEEVELQPDAQQELRRKAEEEAREERYRVAREIAAENEPPSQEQTMGDLADCVRADPPEPTAVPVSTPSRRDTEGPVQVNAAQEIGKDDVECSESENNTAAADDHHDDTTQAPADDEENVDWSESDGGDDIAMNEADEAEAMSAAKEVDVPYEEDDEFEDVEMPGNSGPTPSLRHQPSTGEAMRDAMANPYLMDSDPDDDHQPTTAGPSEASAPPIAPNDEDYMSSSDEELMRQLAIEAEEHARFASSLNTSTKTPAQAHRDYENELKSLRNQQKRDRRDADEVSTQMIQECQALLSLFGLPYITAPMEAEAQCAELVRLGLVDGIVTDDSDIFLFGGTRVYKNMFNAQKFVECYLSADLEKEYALDRKKLIRFAHLLGSDYTEGIQGVGPVTALEILTDFSDLSEFKTWCEKVQSSPGHPSALEGIVHTPFRRKFRNAVLKRVFLPQTFPDLRVDQAYLYPEVDSAAEEFQWGVPDLDKLRSFLMATIGWSQERTDEVLVPVIRDMNRRGVEGTQANITRFFIGGVGVGARAGGRAGGSAVVGGNESEGGGDGTVKNRTVKESGRMKNAYKRLRGEAERRKDREVGRTAGDGVDGADVADGGTDGESAARGADGNGAVVEETANDDGAIIDPSDAKEDGENNKSPKPRSMTNKMKKMLTRKRKTTKETGEDADVDAGATESEDDKEDENWRAAPKALKAPNKKRRKGQRRNVVVDE